MFLCLFRFCAHFSRHRHNLHFGVISAHCREERTLPWQKRVWLARFFTTPLRKRPLPSQNSHSFHKLCFPFSLVDRFCEHTVGCWAPVAALNHMSLSGNTYFCKCFVFDGFVASFSPSSPFSLSFFLPFASGSSLAGPQEAFHSLNESWKRYSGLQRTVYSCFLPSSWACHQATDHKSPHPLPNSSPGSIGTHALLFFS